MTNTRAAILDGKLYLPQQIIDLVGTQHTAVMTRMFQAIWNNYLSNKGATSVPYWYDQFNDDVAFNAFVRHLSKAGWIVSTIEPKRNWGEIRFNDSKLSKYANADEILSMRQFNKFNKYKLTSAVKTISHNPMLQITRSGIAKQDTAEFKYDTVMLAKYQEAITLNVTKSMRVLAIEYGEFHDNVDYEAISKSIVEFHMYSPDASFTLGESRADSRGRAISAALGKVFNPIGYKDARALLVGPERSISLQGYTQIYLAIAELLGDKSDSVDKKVSVAKKAIKSRTLHELDLMTEEGRKDLFENIWLERIYTNLKVYNGSNWTVPLELDASASMLQIEGILLNHKPFLEMTNVLGENLSDPWAFNGIPRPQFKKAMTPLLYGSSKACDELWRANKMSFTTAQVSAFNTEITTGALSVANDFKDFIIQNVVPKESMDVTIWGETFTVHCNRFRSVGDYTKRYNVYDTEAASVKTIYHTHTHREADLEQFRRYFITLLMHNIDSQFADVVAAAVTWCISIFDAFIVMPDEAMDVRTVYTQQLDQLFEDRGTILKEYFHSIGIDSKAAVQWTELKSKCIPVESFKAQLTALK